MENIEPKSKLSEKVQHSLKVIEQGFKEYP